MEWEKTVERYSFCFVTELFLLFFSKTQWLDHPERSERSNRFVSRLVRILEILIS